MKCLEIRGIFFVVMIFIINGSAHDGLERKPSQRTASFHNLPVSTWHHIGEWDTTVVTHIERAVLGRWNTKSVKMFSLN